MSRALRERLERAQADLAALREPLDVKAITADLAQREAALANLEHRRVAEREALVARLAELGQSRAGARRSAIGQILRASISPQPAQGVAAAAGGLMAFGLWLAAPTIGSGLVLGLGVSAVLVLPLLAGTVPRPPRSR